jgi:hypothetical protein
MLGMAESATQAITIEAPAADCFAIVTDFEHYPEWAHDVKEAVVKERDHLDRAVEVEFRASALGRSTHYTLHYDYSDAPDRLAWKLVRRLRLHALRRRAGVHARRVRAVDRAGGPAAGLREAPRRGPHPEHGQGAEGPRRILTGASFPLAYDRGLPAKEVGA